MIKDVEVRPQPVFCIIEHEHRDRVLAEAVRAGRFTHHGVTLELGVEPDWMGAALPEDEEWRIAWSKFYYGLDLAFAFRETGDAGFLRAWEGLVRSWIRRVPIGSEASDVAGRRIQNWIYAWNGFAAAPDFPGLSDGLADEILASLADQVGHLREHLTPERNHRTLELYALFVAALALPQLDPGGTLLDFATRELHCNLLMDILADGVHRECSTHYHMIVLRSFLGARENARRFGLHLGDEYDRRLERACEFALHCCRPDGAIPALSDSDTGDYAGVLELAAALLGRPDFLYSARAGGRGTPPARRYASFEQAGYYTQRSGWGEGRSPFRQERFLIFDCGRLGDGGHGHYDLLSFECSGYGRPLILDPGRYTYSEHPPNWRRWFKGTAAHNTVCVDGFDQTPYQRGKPKKPVAQGRLRARLCAPDFDLLCGEASSPSYEVIHTRWILFVAGEYWIVVDRLRGEVPHHYDLRFHLAPEAWEHTTMARDDGNAVVHAPGLALVFAPLHEPCLEAGWVAPHYGVKLPAPVVRVAAAGDVAADFITLIAPMETRGPAPRLRLAAQPKDGSQAMALEVSGVGPDRAALDRVAWSLSAQRLDLGPVQCYASAAWLRETATGERLAFRACEAREVTWRAGGSVERPADSTQPSWAVWDAGSPVGDGIVWGTRREL